MSHRPLLPMPARPPPAANNASQPNPPKAFPFDIIEEVKNKQWLAGNRYLITKLDNAPSPTELTLAYWSNEDETDWYHMTSLTSTMRKLMFPGGPPAPGEPPFIHCMQHDLTRGGVWKIGSAFFSVRLHPAGNTQEHVTLNALANVEKTFETPSALFAEEIEGGLYVIVQTCMAGTQLTVAWPYLDHVKRDRVWRELAAAQVIVANLFSDQRDQHRRKICGVDGKPLWEGDLVSEFRRRGIRNMRNPLWEAVPLLHLDADDMVFAHNVLVPENVMVDVKTGELMGIAWWANAGFVPKLTLGFSQRFV